jgi:hypothetical protein
VAGAQDSLRAASERLAIKSDSKGQFHASARFTPL